MGLLIAVSGHKRYASKFSVYMYHSAYGGAFGTSKDIKISANELERLMRMYDNQLLLKSKLKRKKLDKVKNRKEDWFIDAETAKELKLFDEYI